MLTQSQREVRRVIPGIPLTDLTMMLVVLIWGVNFSVVKIAMTQIAPLAFTAIRFTIASVVLLGILRLREGAIVWPEGQHFWKMVLFGIIGNTCYQICFTIGLSITTAANAALIIAMTPALIALFGAMLGVERITRSMILGIFLACSGVVFIVATHDLAFSRHTLSGDLLMLLASLCWAIYTLGVRSIDHTSSPLNITTLTMVTGTFGLVLIGIPDLLRTDWGAVSMAAWGGLGYAALLGLVVAYFLWNNSVRLVGGNRTAIYGCAIPLVAALVAWPLLGEQLTVLQGIGAVLIVTGVLLTRHR